MADARLILSLVVVLSVACGKAPTPTGPATPNAPAGSAALVGTWKGMFDVASCVGTACSLGPQAFILRLDSTGRGVIQVDSDIYSTSPPLAVDVVVEPGAVPVVATAANATPLSARVVLTEYGEVLQGPVEYTATRNDKAVTRQGRILYATRDRTSFAGRFEGQWLGYATRTQCEGSCADDPLVIDGAGNAIRWNVSQAGGAVQGLLNSFAFTGTVNGSQLTGTIRYAIPASACRAGWDQDPTVCLLEATIEGTVDALDRLTGTLTYRAEGRDWRDRPYALTATSTLSGVARWTH